MTTLTFTMTMTTDKQVPSNFIETYTGKLFDWRNPQVDIRDVAHSLSNICRFNGHTKFHYSVASHCILVSFLCGLFDGDSLEGLLHDATETYICDIPTPVKLDFPQYKKEELKLHKHVATAFTLPNTISDKVKEADLLSLYIEADMLLPSKGQHYHHHRPSDDLFERGKQVANTFYPIVQRDPPDVEAFYIQRFYQLKNRRENED